MDIIDNYYCPNCGNELKRNVSNGVLYSTSCSCGYKNKSTLNEIANAHNISDAAKNNNKYANKFRDRDKDVFK